MTYTFAQFGTSLAKSLVRWLQARLVHKLEKYVAVHHMADR